MRAKAMSRRLRVLLFITAIPAVPARPPFATTAFVADSPGTIQACGNAVNGVLRAVDGPGDCRNGERSLSWPAQAAGGGALAFAHITQDGTLDVSRSKSVASAS